MDKAQKALNQSLNIYPDNPAAQIVLNAMITEKQKTRLVNHNQRPLASEALSVSSLNILKDNLMVSNKLPQLMMWLNYNPEIELWY